MQATRLGLAGIVGVLGLTILVAMPTNALAKQCIWNKAGFILEARWYEQDDVKAFKNGSGDWVIEIDAEAEPVQEDRWPVAQGRCTRNANENKDLAVILSVVDGKIATDFMKVAGGIYVAGATAVSAGALAAACPVTGVTCLLAGATITGGSAASSAVVASIPDAQEIFYVGVPSSEQYLDVWGTIWSPQTGPGGPIN